jgi:hypothetical protein
MADSEIGDLQTEILKLQRQVAGLTKVAEHLFTLVGSTQRFTEQSDTAYREIPKLLEHVRHPDA